MGTIGGEDGKGKLGYINLCSQIADARNTKYTDNEICRAVRKAIAVSSYLRTYFDSQENMQLDGMLSMLRDYYREKTAAELFTELGSLCQNAKESATDFLLRSFELRQKVVAAATAEGDVYDVRLIYRTFCRSMRTGLRNDSVRTHMRQFLDPKALSPTNDGILLKEMNMAASEIDELTTKQAVMKRFQ